MLMKIDVYFRCWEGEAKVGRSGYLSQAGFLVLPVYYAQTSNVCTQKSYAPIGVGDP
jgi:hypothetical protein